MKKLLLAATAFTSLSAVAVQAAQINGTVPVVAGVSLFQGANKSSLVPGINLLNGTELKFNIAGFSYSGASGDFATAAGNDPHITNFSLLINPLGTLNFSGPDGSFTSTSSVTLAHTANNYDLFLIGTFTPSPTGDLSAFAANTASVHLSVNESINPSTGLGSVSAGITLASPSVAPPPPSVPEPASMALLGAGLLGLGMARRRRG